MTIQSILVATDLSADESIAVQRALRLAEMHRASVKLMYMPLGGQQVPATTSARLASAARELEESFELRIKTVPVRANKLELLAAEARGMDLFVLSHRTERSAAAFFLGQPVLRLLRLCNCPVLVTRPTSGGHYRRILVAVNFSVQSEALVKLAAGLDPQAELEIFHAISTLGEARLRAAEATEQAVRAYRDRCLRHAQEKMLSLTDSFDTRRNRLLAVIGRGDPARQTLIQQEHSDADLVVLGKRRASAWQDFIGGSVAQRVLSWGSGDVLLVPQGSVPAPTRVAARRIRRGAVRLALRPAARRAS